MRRRKRRDKISYLTARARYPVLYLCQVLFLGASFLFLTLPVAGDMLSLIFQATQGGRRCVMDSEPETDRDLALCGLGLSSWTGEIPKSSVISCLGPTPSTWGAWWWQKAQHLCISPFRLARSTDPLDFSIFQCGISIDNCAPTQIPSILSSEENSPDSRWDVRGAVAQGFGARGEMEESNCPFWPLS